MGHGARPIEEGSRATSRSRGVREASRRRGTEGGVVELPEVEVMRRDLEKDVVGRRVKSAEVRPSKNAMRVIRRHGKRKEFTSRLEGHKIAKVERHGKYILMELDDGDVLVTHF